MKRSFSYLRLLIIPLLALSCHQKPDDEITRDIQNGLQKYYFHDGKIYLEINYKDGLPHGVMKRYYRMGNVLEERTYVKGELHGPSKTFHENGRVSRQTCYRNGKMDGIQKKYRSDGTLAFEAPYHIGNPCVGLKEYYLSGNPVRNYPSILTVAKDEILKDDWYTLYIALSDKSKSVTFYKGELTDSLYIGDNAEMIWTEDGIAKLYLHLPRNSNIVEKVNIIAKAKTELGNFYITQAQFSISAEPL
jgi:antitoxin component YwqK of YwqJK toxin-antitoxin module